MCPYCHATDHQSLAKCPRWTGKQAHIHHPDPLRAPGDVAPNWMDDVPFDGRSGLQRLQQLKEAKQV